MVKYYSLLLGCITVFASAQDLTFSVAEKLPADINTDCEEIFPLLSPDKKTLYFARSSCLANTGGKFAGTDIWVSQFSEVTKKWGKSHNGKNVFNDKAHNALVGISNDGTIIYQLNTSPTRETRGIYFSKRLNSSWTQPELIHLPFLSTEGFVGLYVSPDFDVIFISMKGSDSAGQEDLYVCTKNKSGEWTEPRNLGLSINTEGFEMSPFLSSDKKRLYFTSSGHWGLGDGDIFYTDRLDETWEKWSNPVNLGAHINSKKFDAYFSIYDSLAYFSSNRDREYSDLYVTRVLRRTDDSTQQRINRIVAEANSILVDLGDDTPDSLSTNQSSVFIDFEINSADLNSKATTQLNSVIDNLKKLELNKVTLVAYTSSQEIQNENLSYKRLEVLKNYLNKASLPHLIVGFEFKKQHDTGNGKKIGLVEVRYKLE
jgi:outer membrane protein OmpA-like peptidoglycan-associated protein